MALGQARIGNAHEFCILAQVLDRSAAGIPHGRLYSADELVDHSTCGALVGHLAFDPFGYQLLLADVRLEIAIGAAPRQRGNRDA